jgi:hypothetical protein
MTDTPTLDAFLADIAALKARNAELEAPWRRPPRRPSRLASLAARSRPSASISRTAPCTRTSITRCRAGRSSNGPHRSASMPCGWRFGLRRCKQAGTPLDGSRCARDGCWLDAATVSSASRPVERTSIRGCVGAPITQGDLVEFWSDFADAFQGHPALLGYGLMNEPPADISGWPETCQACVDTIREVDEQTLIIVPGRGAWTWNWTQINNTMDQVKDPSGRMCHEAHQYADSDSSGRFAYSYEGHEWPRWTREMGEGNQLDWLTAITKPYHSWLKERGVRGILGETGIPSSCMWRGDLNAWAPHWDYRDGWLGMLRRYVTQAASDGVPVFLWTAGQHYAENKLAIAYDAPAGVANPVADLIARAERNTAEDCVRSL